jgi:nitroimidazol reductase NimA-like FMN-containing flavoprotein (pyridoxamine 5'-phosphate oxidase superfamily)
MTLEPITELNPDFSSPEAVARPWSEVVDVLTTSEMFWLSTVRADGRPHVTPLPAMWFDGLLYFTTGPGEQKARNLEHHPDVVLTTGTSAYRSGLDVVVEGRAEPVTDAPKLHALAAMWKTKLDWPYEVADGGFKHDGDHLALVFGVAPAKVLAFGKGEPFSQTRYRFGA